MPDKFANAALAESGYSDYLNTLKGDDLHRQRIPERIVSAIWFDRNYDKNSLCTNDERKIEVISPGRWNEGPGPDFLEAEIMISGRKKIRGDVEIEVFTSDWDKHFHKKNTDFGNVVLRVSLWNDIKKPLKSKIPLLVLSPFVTGIPELGNYNTQGYPFASQTMRGNCQALVEKASQAKLEEIIEHEGRNRLELKAYRFGMLSHTFGKDQTLYKGIMEALGYSANKDPMSRLSDVVNIDFINKHIGPIKKEERHEYLMAALFAHCGIFSRKETFAEHPYLNELYDVWLSLGIGDQPIVIEGFRLAKIRPANNPYRRLAAMAHLLANIDGFKLYQNLESFFDVPEDQFDAKATLKKLLKLFTSVSDKYWENHSGLNPTPLKKPLALIGKGLAITIVANIILPMALGTIKKSENAWKAVAELKGLPHNHKTRHTCCRMFGPDMAQPLFARRLLTNQGLIQLYEDHCKKLHQECPDCAIAFGLK